MKRTTLHVVLVATMVLLAGCAGGLSGTPAAGDGSNPDDGSTPGVGSMDGSGTVNLYISDQPAAIEDFEHLNVTISSVGFHPAGADDTENDSEEFEVDDDNETDTSNESDDTDLDDAANVTASTDDDDDDDDADEVNETEVADADEDGGWIEHDVDGRVADLTELKGDNATLLGEFDVPHGNYTTVFVHVSAVNATLTTGESVNVKLPSEKLQIHQRFAVSNGSQVDFVFDIAVHKAGNSGKYILRPVISESGTDVPINRIDDPGEDRDETERNETGEPTGLNVSFVGDVSPGQNATIEVMSDGAPVENATVFLGDEQIGVTAANGRLTFEMPDGEELEITVRHDDGEVELERSFEGQGDGRTGQPSSDAGQS